MKTFQVTGKKYSNGEVIQKNITAACEDLATLIFNSTYKASAYFVKEVESQVKKRFCDCDHKNGMCIDAFDARTPDHLLYHAWLTCPRREKDKSEL